MFCLLVRQVLVAVAQQKWSQATRTVSGQKAVVRSHHCPKEFSVWKVANKSWPG